MQDKYKTLEELRATLQENASYRIICHDHQSWLTVISPHGGLIEGGSSALAHAIAGRNYNLFDFQGLQRENAQELHVSSTRFREARLNALLSRSVSAISFHVMGPQNEPIVWLGGLNLTLKEMVLKALRSAGFSVNPDSPLYRGESRKNVVNLAERFGVQLELSDELITELFAGPAFRGDFPVETTKRFKLFTQAISAALHQYETAKYGQIPA